jgi:cytochrome c553
VHLAAGAALASEPVVPAWLYAENSPDGASLSPIARVPGSHRRYSRAILSDLYSGPDWHPASHDPMPEVVAHGLKPLVLACGYCHTPGGQGRPENASLAGLPASYIVAQVASFRSGERRGAWPGRYLPTELMIATAKEASAEEVEAAAAYFAAQRPAPRVRVLERERVPRARVVGLVYVATGGMEALGERLLEFAPDARRHEDRDDALVYLAYAPVGSLARGRELANAGAAPCVSCHGAQLEGVGAVPRLAGRSPTYLLRALWAFKTGARGGVAALPMQAVVAPLAGGELIALSAYAASLGP